MIKKLFAPNLDQILGELTDIAEDLQAFKQFAGSEIADHNEKIAEHNEKIADHQQQINAHKADAERASRVSEKLLALLA